MIDRWDRGIKRIHTHINTQINILYIYLYSYVRACVSFWFANGFSTIYTVTFLALFFFNVYLLLRERECKQGRDREREGDTGSKAGSATHIPRVGDLSRSRTLTRLSHSGTPISCFIHLINTRRSTSFGLYNLMLNVSIYSGSYLWTFALFYFSNRN